MPYGWTLCERYDGRSEKWAVGLFQVTNSGGTLRDFI